MSGFVQRRHPRTLSSSRRPMRLKPTRSPNAEECFGEKNCMEGLQTAASQLRRAPYCFRNPILRTESKVEQATAQRALEFQRKNADLGTGLSFDDTSLRQPREHQSLQISGSCSKCRPQRQCRPLTSCLLSVTRCNSWAVFRDFYLNSFEAF